MATVSLFDPAEVVDSFCRLRGVPEWLILDTSARGLVSREREYLSWILADLCDMTSSEVATLMGWDVSTVSRRRATAANRVESDGTYREMLGDMTRLIRRDLGG